jgi:hypothetical protein
MKSIINSDSVENVAPLVQDSFRLALSRFNRLVEMEEFPPFKKILLGQSEFSDYKIFETKLGKNFGDALVSEFRQVDRVYNSTDDASELINLFTNSFSKIYKDFANEIHIADIYLSYYRDAEAALIAAEVFENPSLESVWGSPIPDGTYRCEQCSLDHSDYVFDFHAQYRCEECDEILEFDSGFPEAVGFEEGRGGRAGTARRLANRVLEAVDGRRTGAAPTATTGQILRESVIGKKIRAIRKK